VILETMHSAWGALSCELAGRQPHCLSLTIEDRCTMLPILPQWLCSPLQWPPWTLAQNDGAAASNATTIAAAVHQASGLVASLQMSLFGIANELHLSMNLYCCLTYAGLKYPSTKASASNTWLMTEALDSFDTWHSILVPGHKITRIYLTLDTQTQLSSVILAHSNAQNFCDCFS